MKTSLRHLIATTLAGTALSLPASAQSPSTAIESATRINAANALVREGMIAEAIADYEQVHAAEADRHELNYNLAVAEYRQGNIESAKTRFTKSATTSDTSLAARSRYNLGNCFYSDAVRAAEQDKPLAIESLRLAISHYRGSLTGNPNHVDARANIELAGELLKELQEEQKQAKQNQNQQQSSDQNQSDPQHADQQQPHKQDSKSEQSEPSKDQSQQGDQQNESNQPKQETQQHDQTSESNPDAPHQSDQAQQNQSDSQDSNSDQSKDSLSEPSASEQQPMNQSQSQQDMQSPAGDQPQHENVSSESERDESEQAVPAGELTAANEQEADGIPNGRVAIADPNAKDGLMTKQEALKMLQAVRDRDMLRRLQQEQAERSRHIAVDRDW